MRHLNRAVVCRGRIFPPGTTEDTATGVPDGPWWDGFPSPVLDADVSGFNDAMATAEKSTAVEPPRSGKGSGVKAWREYADKVGVTYPDDATRDDIIALVDGQ